MLQATYQPPNETIRRPVYFQAVKGASPVKSDSVIVLLLLAKCHDRLPRSAVDFFSVAFIIAPFAIVAGATIAAMQAYKPQNIIAWGQLQTTNWRILYLPYILQSS